MPTGSSRIVCFSNRDGILLRGMLHEPDPTRSRGVCLLLLSPGIKGRVGPHRLYLKIAERVVPLGFHVLRFDFYGLGDSEGRIDESLLSDMYNSIQDGRYVNDTQAAMDWVEKNYAITRFVGSGLCGGSISALLAAAQDARIVSMLALSIPTAFDGGEANWARFATDRQFVNIRRNYVKRMFKPHSWVRFMTGKTNYYVLWSSIKRLLPGARGRPPQETMAPVEAIATTDGTKDDTNPKFAPAFLRLARGGRRMLLIFSGADRLTWDFEEKFEARHRVELEPLRTHYRVVKIANANHALTDPAWVKEVLDAAAVWLDDVHPECK